MHYPELPDRNLASHSYFSSGYELLTVNEADEPAAATVACEDRSVADIANAGAYDHATIKLILTAEDRQFLDTGVSDDARPATSSYDISHGTKPGPLSLAGSGWDDNTMTLSLKGGTPVRFARRTDDYAQYRAHIESWTEVAAPVGAYGLDFTDALLSAMATKMSIIVPSELRPTSVGGTWKTVDEIRGEAERRDQRHAYLRDQILTTRFAQNAGRVSILAVLPRSHIS